MTVQDFSKLMSFADETGENPVVQPIDAPAENPFSLAWTLQAILGMGLLIAGAIVIHETFSILMIGSTEWMQCLNSDGTFAFACASDLNATYTYRFGIDATTALLLGIFAAFMGPIPILTMLNRYRNNNLAGVLFFVMMLPYGMLGFLLLILALMSIVFYGVGMFA